MQLHQEPGATSAARCSQPGGTCLMCRAPTRGRSHASPGNLLQESSEPHGSCAQNAYTIPTNKFDRFSIGPTKSRAYPRDNAPCNRIKIKCQTHRTSFCRSNRPIYKGWSGTLVPDSAPAGLLSKIYEFWQSGSENWFSIEK